MDANAAGKAEAPFEPGSMSSSEEGGREGLVLTRAER